jgi:hypothetical protein
MTMEAEMSWCGHKSKNASGHQKEEVRNTFSHTGGDVFFSSLFFYSMPSFFEIYLTFKNFKNEM